MKLIRNGIYNNGCSCLYFKVIYVKSIKEDYIEVRGLLIDRNKSIHEGPKDYKLVKENIKEWYRVSGGFNE